MFYVVNSAGLIWGVYGDKIYDNTSTAVAYFMLPLMIMGYMLKIHY